IAFWGVLIWAAYAVITNLTRKPDTPDSGNDARRILDQRLAKGEISPEEYQRLRGLIGSDTHHAATGARGGERPPGKAVTANGLMNAARRPAPARPGAPAAAMPPGRMTTSPGSARWRARCAACRGSSRPMPGAPTW